MADFVLTLVVMGRETGIWCPRCLLPSGYRLDYAIGLTLQTFTRCVECCEPIP